MVHVYCFIKGSADGLFLRVVRVHETATRAEGVLAQMGRVIGEAM